MATEQTSVRQTAADGSERVERTTVEREVTPSPLGMVRNVIYVIFFALETLLFIRFLLSLFGANRLNGFADFIYSLSAPFIAPFRGLFSIDSSIGLGAARFEYEVIIAMIVYAVVAMLILMVLRIPEQTEAE